MFTQVIQGLKEAARALKPEVVVLQLVLRDPRVSVLPKLIGFLTISYLISPIDLISDFVPVVGLLDDLILIPLAIRLVLWLIPKEILEELRRAARNESISIKAARWPAIVCILIIWFLGLLLLAGVVRF